MNPNTVIVNGPGVHWPWFIVGCILLGAALAACAWGLSHETLSPSRRFLLMWLLPLASGFSCGSFLGSMKAEGPLTGTGLGVTVVGGFAVWLLSYFLLPKLPEDSGGITRDTHQERQRAAQIDYLDPATWTPEEKSIADTKAEILRIKDNYEQLKTAPQEARILAADIVERSGLKLGVNMLAIRDDNVAIHRRVNKYTYAALAYYMVAYVVSKPERKREYSKIAVQCTDKSLALLEKLRIEAHAGNPAPIMEHGYKFTLTDQAADRALYYKAVALAINVTAGGEYSVTAVRAIWESISPSYRALYPPNNSCLVEALKLQELG